LVVIDKPPGMTSHDVVNRVRRLFGIRRVGHTGTLDPMATGVLVVCLGQATRIVEYLAADHKVYVAGVTFGVQTDSQDATGVVTAETDSSALMEEDLRRALEGFRGLIRQVPPMVSAVHHEGKRLYELARKGMEVERAAREVEIYRLDLVDFEPGPRAVATLQVECSTGTYIRTLAADIGEALGVGASLHSLRRTRAGRFTLNESVTLELLEELRLAGSLAGYVVSIPRALSNWPQVVISEEERQRVSHGMPVAFAWSASIPHLLVDCTGCAVAVAEPREPELLAPEKVFARGA
jgi:tRNA pseudouridine55 synthase